MSLFFSPSRLLEIMKDKETIQSYLIPCTKEWYFSEAGHQAYNKASTVPDKTVFFYNYLYCISPQKNNLLFLERIAFIMANSMDQSNLPFAGYPNILDEGKNPFVAFVETGVELPKENNSQKGLAKKMETALLLAVLRGESSIEEYLLPPKKPYLKLTYPTDGTYSDIQKIERNIIWSGKYDEKDKLDNPPLQYEILSKIVMAEMNEDEENDYE